MYCKNCGAEIDDNAVVCVKCGVLVSEKRDNIEVENNVNKHNVLGIIGFIGSLVSFFISLFCIVPLASLIVSSIGFAQRKKYLNEKLTVAGFIISIIAVVASFIFYCIIIIGGIAGLL